MSSMSAHTPNQIVAQDQEDGESFGRRGDKVLEENKLSDEIERYSGNFKGSEGIASIDQY